MSEAKLQAARELVDEQRYDEARALLRTMPNNTEAAEWLTKLDALAPVGTPSRKITPKNSHMFEEWVKAEKVVTLIFGIVLLVVAVIFLFFRPIPAFLIIGDQIVSNSLTPLQDILGIVALLGGMYAIWFSKQEDRIRRFLLRLRAKDQRWGAAMNVFLAVIFLPLGIISGDGLRILLGLFNLFIVALCWWRAGQAAKLLANA